MVRIEQLEQMSSVTWEDWAADDLTDVTQITIRGESALERLESFLRQVGNPYCFKVGNVPVRIAFRQEGAPLEEKLKAHFIAHKQKT